MTASDKTRLRRDMRAKRRQTAAELPDAVRALVFSTPPAPVLERIAGDAVIGLYRATPDEAPASRYAQFFLERGHRIALPRLNGGDGAMGFAAHTDPLDASDLEPGPFDLLQPASEAEGLTPDVLFVPLVAFDETGARLGQGGGHYDRWFARHPDALRIGLAWDTQKLDDVPTEPHDLPLNLIVTPTRIYGA